MLVGMENFKSRQYGRLSVIQELDNYQDATREVLSNLRSVLFDLRGNPEVGSAFLPRVTAAIKRFQAASGIQATIRVSPRWPREIAAQSAAQLERIIDESLNNIRLHSGAQKVSVGLQANSEDRVTLRIRDDGRGVRPAWAAVAGLGTMGMRERALLLGGELKIVSAVPHGTTVIASFPKRNLL